MQFYNEQFTAIYSAFPCIGKDRHSQIVLGHRTKQSKNDKVW